MQRSNASDAVNRAQKRAHKALFWLSFVLLAAIATSSCSSTTKQDVFDLPCGTGRLVLHETFVAGFSIDKATLELRYHTDRSVRIVSVLMPNMILYRDPTPNEHYRRFRGRGPGDPWPVFVDPKRFTLSEYDQICKTLSKNLGVIDAAVIRPRKPIRRFWDYRKPMISSIRYVDCNDFCRLYDSPDKRFKIEVNPNGQVWLLGEGLKSHTTRASIGFVADNGSKVVLDPNSGSVAQMTDNLVTNLHTFVRQCVDVRGRTLRDDFIVEVPLNAEAYRIEGNAWMKRRDSRR
ncbi:MAG: hypothetical protein V2A78_05585 [bacterium]